MRISGPDPFLGQPVEPIGQFRRGGESVGIEAQTGVGVMGVEPEEAQDAQVILDDPVIGGVADEPDAPRLEVRQAPRLRGIEDNPVAGRR